ncbi:hypothetical protein HD554DRAFT_2000154, partial [Boletus coccyginus]
LTQYWTAWHTKAFTQLKSILFEKPVLQASKFDGMSFILITYALKDELSVILAQCFITTLPDKEMKTIIH